MRCNYTFTYVSVSSLGVESALASVTVPSISTLGTPLQVHLALTGNIDEMAVTWVTGIPLARV